jgi:starch-binding outer membrane protein SusE/F
MRSLFNYILLLTGLTLFLAACDKVDDLPYYRNGSASTLTASSTTIAPPPADSNKVALTLSWTYPNYATDSSNIRYRIEIDSTGKNFANPYVVEVIGQMNTSFTAKELNNILLARGYAFNVPVDMDVRLITSYANNNERITANTVKIKMTPYKVPPKVALPTTNRLFIVGDATDFGWSNDAAPPFPPTREFTRLEETVWAGIFNLKGSGAYKLLQTQGVWNTQYHMIAGGTAEAGSFELKDADPGFPSPSTAGSYKIVFNFQTGTYMVSKVDNPVPNNLYITGDAVPSNWTENPPASQKFTHLSNGLFEITMDLQPGKVYKFLSTLGQWQPQFGGSSATSGPLGANYGGGNDPAAVPTPTTAGTYKITVNFLTNTYTVVKI